MKGALLTAVSGMRVQQQNVDIITNNLANINTAGFKKSRGDFEDLMYMNLKNVGAPVTNDTQIPNGIQIGLGAKLAGVTKVFTPGEINITGVELDMAIEGEGFFQVLNSDGSTVYTRNGAFKKDSQGKIVNQDGFPMVPEMVIPNNSTHITIGSDGTVTVMQPGQNTPTNVGTIQLAIFNNPAGLSSLGKNLFKNTDSSGAPITGTPGQTGIGTLSQGFLEASNVNPVEEMVSMIVSQRAYEINSKSVQAVDEMYQQANNLRR